MWGLTPVLSFYELRKIQLVASMRLPTTGTPAIVAGGFAAWVFP
jgi:hypothetical protein